MSDLKNTGVIFDLDGILWDASRQIVPAWNTVLNRYPSLHTQITVSDMQGFMGKTIDVIAAIMFPDLHPQHRLQILQECCREEQVYLTKHGGTLYPGLEDVLGTLQMKYSLFIVSNCQDGYAQAFLDYHRLSPYFTDFEVAGRIGLTKGENISLVIQRNSLDRAVYVGDTTGDAEGAALAGIPFIHAAYGFGKVDTPDYTISAIQELPEILPIVFREMQGERF